jgi:pimeloyl-ACP methyl ester carboxylesterase
MHEFQFRTRSGLFLNVADSQTTGPPLLLLHGVTRRWQDWVGVLPALTPFWRCYAFDARGHGKSTRTPGAYRIADYVPDLVEFVSEKLEQPALLIGHSLGGNLAAAVAAQAAPFVRGVVLEDPPLAMAGEGLAQSPFPSAFRVFLKYAGSTQATGEIAALLAEERVRAPGKSELVRFGDVRDTVSLRFAASCLKQLDPEVLEWALSNRWMDGSHIDETLSAISAPTLLLQADVNIGGILPDAEAKAAASRIRDVAHIKLPMIGHNIHSNATETFLRLVVPFLASID